MCIRDRCLSVHQTEYASFIQKLKITSHTHSLCAVASTLVLDPCPPFQNPKYDTALEEQTPSSRYCRYYVQRHTLDTVSKHNYILVHPMDFI